MERYRSRFGAPLLIMVPIIAVAHIIGASPASMTKIVPKQSTKKQAKILTAATRKAFIQRAQVWMPTDIPALDLRIGPAGKGAFPPDSQVMCDYVEKEKLPGTSPKFDCDVGDGDVVKVRYGADNGKVEAAVLASRLLWALGFGADRLVPVVVTCRGCAADPWKHRTRVAGEQVFDPAAIERKPLGQEMKGEHKGGWTWPELDLVEEQAGGASLAQREAFKLVAILIQHTDSKPENERLLCLPGGLTADGCAAPFLMMHDVGLTFGHGNAFNRNDTSSLNFALWSTTPVWRDPRACVAHMSQSLTGTLGDPTIHEAGRQFLADLLVQLSDQQLHDLFGVAHVDRRSRDPNRKGVPPATVDEWVAAFQQKRDQIVHHRCPL